MVDTAPKVSVVLNCYNHEAYVGEAIESVLAQTFPDFELIITDNGSTDGTRAVIERYDDPRIIRKYHDANESLSRRLNQAVAMARGEFVCVLYSDDMMLPDKLERQLALFAALPAEYGVVYAPPEALNQCTGARWLHASIGLSGDMIPEMLRRFWHGQPDMSSPLIRRACFAAAWWHEDLFSDGEAILLRIALRWKFQFDAHPNVVLRDHGGNMGKAIQKNHDMFVTMLDRLAAEPAFPAACRRDLTRLRAQACRNHAWVALRLDTSDTAWVRRQLRAAALAPTVVAHPRWFGGWALALLPGSVRAALNRVGRRLVGGRENAALVSDY